MNKNTHEMFQQFLFEEDLSIYRSILKVISMAVAPVVIAFTIYDLFAGRYLVGGILIIMLVINLGAILFSQRKIEPQTEYHIYRISFTMLIAVFSVYLLFAIGYEAGLKKLPWVYIFPVFTFVVIGQNKALILNSVVLVLLILLNLTNNAIIDSFHQGFILRFSISYILITLFTYTIEHAKSKYKYKLFHTQQNLKKSEECYRIAYEKLQDEIEERIKAENNLRKNEKKYKMITDNATDIIVTMDMEKTCTFISPSVDKIFECSPCECISKKFEDILEPDLFKYIKHTFMERLASDEERKGKPYVPLKLEFSHIRKNQLTVNCEMTTRFLRDEAENPIGAIGIIRDITKRKKAEIALQKAHEELEMRVKARTMQLVLINKQLQNEINERIQTENKLRVSETRFKELTNLLPETIYEMDTKGQLTFMNQNGFLKFQISEKDIEKRINGFDLVSEEDRPRAYENAINILHGEEAGLHEYTMACKNGRTFPAILHSSVIKRQNKTLGIRGIIIDISKLKKTEKALRSSEMNYYQTVANSPNPIFSVDKDLRIITWNKACEKLFEYDTSIIGKKFLLLFEADALKSSMEEKVTRVFQNETINNIEVVFKSKHKNDILTVSRLFPVIGENGHVHHCVIGNTDITARKLADEALKKAYQELKNTQAQLIQTAKLASIGELAAGIAHELNQPLMIIRTNYQLIDRAFEKQAPGKLDIQYHLDLVDKSTKRMMKIIKHLRTFSRESQTDFLPIEIDTIIKNAFLMMGEQLRIIGIENRNELMKPLPLILGDENQLEQVFLNLIANARDAIEEKRRNQSESKPNKIFQPDFIKFITRINSKNHDMIEIVIKDSGCGIPEMEADKLFDPFFTTKPPGSGTGLGLSISYGIVKNHKGNIYLEQSSPKGTTFVITLPVSTV